MVRCLMLARPIASLPMATAPIASAAIATGAMAVGPRTPGPRTSAPVTGSASRSTIGRLGAALGSPGRLRLVEVQQLLRGDCHLDVVLGGDGHGADDELVRREVFSLQARVVEQH